MEIQRHAMRCVWKKTGRRRKGDTWWWTEEMNEAVSWKKEANKEMCRMCTMENKIRHKSMKNKAKNAVSRAMS